MLPPSRSSKLADQSPVHLLGALGSHLSVGESETHMEGRRQMPGRLFVQLTRRAKTATTTSTALRATLQLGWRQPNQ